MHYTNSRKGHKNQTAFANFTTYCQWIKKMDEKKNKSSHNEKILNRKKNTILDFACQIPFDKEHGFFCSFVTNNI